MSKCGNLNVDPERKNIVDKFMHYSKFIQFSNLRYNQSFWFMVGPGHCPMISKYGPSLSKAVAQWTHPF